MELITMGIGAGGTISDSVLMGLDPNPPSSPTVGPDFIHNEPNLFERISVLLAQWRDAVEGS